MAKLKDYRAPRADVKLSDDETYTVRGLSLSDLMEGFNAYNDQMQLIFKGFRDGDLSQDELGGALMEAIRTAPDLVAMLISRAADEPDELATVRAMPIDDQCRFATAVLDLTLRDGLVLKKVFEIVAKWQSRIPTEAKN